MSLLLAVTSAAAVPHLEKQGTAERLIVNNMPMLLLAGELGNSSASSARYMAPHWSRLKQMHLNTVLTPVSWELIEPVEGRFEWDSVDALIRAARAQNLKLVLLWFGAWKNSMSTYVPSWVKRDQARFPRAQLPNGSGLDILSAFATATRDADSRAFSALLAHLKEVDGDRTFPILIGIWPLNSYKQALRLNNEVPGIVIPASLLKSMESAGASARDRGFAVAREMLAWARTELAGAYLIPPFKRYEEILEIL